MATEVFLPRFGQTMEEAKILQWLKKEGDPVKQGEPLFEIETDKVTQEIEANGSGVLRKIVVPPGTTVPAGTTIGVIAGANEDIGRLLASLSAAAPGAPPAAPAPAPQPAAAAAPVMASAPPPLRAAVAAPPAVRPTAAAAGAAGFVPASPIAKRLAKEHGIDLREVAGSGQGGMVRERDVLKLLEARSAVPAGIAERVAARPGRAVPMTAMQKVVAERLARNKQAAPHFYLSMDVDMGAAVEFREKGRAYWEARGMPVPSYNDFVVKAVALALKAHPLVNSTVEGETIVLHEDIHVGMAMALEDEALVVPVIRHADRLGLGEMARASGALMERARQKKLTPEDYAGGTFTVSNLGMHGVKSFTAIINPPQSGILAVGAIQKQLVVRDESMAIRPLMAVTMSSDHRVIYGVLAAKFVQTVKAHLEDPKSLES
ncbi:MAG TPA: dihydrolipoamide acetyltransferase family protein [Candidatus Sulfotelmatobacter sp.]|nr:dihydrolipoamide acetyltransferase family protein [Candidatus Sulfotelmatobacter sp.]